jgi:hypothetical protein
VKEDENFRAPSAVGYDQTGRQNEVCVERPRSDISIVRHILLGCQDAVEAQQGLDFRDQLGTFLQKVTMFWYETNGSTALRPFLVDVRSPLQTCVSYRWVCLELLVDRSVEVMLLGPEQGSPLFKSFNRILEVDLIRNIVQW